MSRQRSVMEKVKVEQSVGMVLAHDITRIVPGKEKGPAFKKGHVVTEADVPELLKLGKRHIYVLNLTEDLIHEDDAALRIAEALCDPNLYWTTPHEGKTNLTSKVAGLLKVDVDTLRKVNRIGEIIVATLKNNFPVRKDQIVAATRIIPLVTEIKRIETLEKLAASVADPVLRVRAFRPLNVGAVVTGSEIVNGLIKDEFDAYVGKKVAGYGAKMMRKLQSPDDPSAIAEAVSQLASEGCDIILLTGGLSVDPDDVTRRGIERSGADVRVYGAPILPGAMFLHARLGNIEILGLPACVYYHPTTIFDLTFPRILAGDPFTPDDIAEMGHGGLCLNCDVCRFPVCPFGK